jgi:hypothetical protein
MKTTQEVANRFYELAQQGNWNTILDELFSEQARSIEPAHSSGLTSVNGLDKIREKAMQWESMIEQVHGGYCNQPQVAGNFFVCTMGVDLTMKGQPRSEMHEVALYEVHDGKIISEQFFY